MASFLCFVPAPSPQCAVAVLYEGDVDASFHGGSNSASMIGKIFREVYKVASKKDRPCRAQPVENEPTPEEDASGD